MSRHSRLAPLAVSALAVGLSSFAAQLFVVASPLVRDHLGLTKAELGWLFSASLVTGVAGSLAAGWLADRGRLRAAAAGSMALVVVAYVLCAFEPSFARYLIGLALAGIGNYAIGTAANVAVMRAYADTARRSLTILQLAVAGIGMAAPIVWAAVLPRLAATSLGFGGAIQVLFGVSAIGCAVVLPAVLLVALPDRRDAAAKPHPTEGSARWAGGMALIVVCAFVILHTAADNGMYVWIPEYVTRRFDPAPFPAAWIIAGYSGAYLVGRLVLASLPGKVDDLAVLGTAAAIGAILTTIAFRSDTEYGLAIFYVTAGLSLSVDYPSILSYIGSQFPRSAGRVVALSGAVSAGGAFVVPPLMGFLGERAGDMMVGMMVPPAMLLVLSFAAFARRARLARTAVAPASVPAASDAA